MKEDLSKLELVAVSDSWKVSNCLVGVMFGGLLKMDSEFGMMRSLPRYPGHTASDEACSSSGSDLSGNIGIRGNNL